MFFSRKRKKTDNIKVFKTHGFCRAFFLCVCVDNEKQRVYNIFGLENAVIVFYKNKAVFSVYFFDLKLADTNNY